MSSPLQTILLENLAFTRERLMDIISKFPEEQAVFQVCPTDCHLLWTLGHLAVTDIWLLGALNPDGPGITVPEAWNQLFSFGSTVSTEATDYPPLEALRERFHATHEVFCTFIASLDDNALMDDAPAARSNGFVPNAARGSAIKAWHEGWHAGQLSSLRKALGLGSAFAG
ncbi:MAG: DinB family protein [Phycisphaerales bacterium]|nr:DinB family protein [Phycisphaerales bacterium]